PDLATAWSLSEEGTQLTFLLRDGVRWHDGEPFTAKDVKCTWDLLTGQSSEKLRLNPRKSWYRNLKEVTINGENEVTFHMQRPQPAFTARLASGFSGLSLPCSAGRDASASDRHRSVQICRIQAQRADHADAQPELLEEGPALPGWDRVSDLP